MSPYIEEAVRRCKLPIIVGIGLDDLYEIKWRKNGYLRYRVWGHHENAKIQYLSAVKELTHAPD